MRGRRAVTGPVRGRPRGVRGVGAGRRTRGVLLLERLPQRVDFLRDRADPYVVVIDFLSHDAEVARERVDHQLLVGERLASRAGLLVEPGIDGPERLTERRVQRSDQILQLLRLLLEHADVGHELLMFLVGRVRRPCNHGGERERDERACQCLPHGLRHWPTSCSSHFAVITKCARRFLTYAFSS